MKPANIASIILILCLIPFGLIGSDKELPTAPDSLINIFPEAKGKEDNYHTDYYKHYWPIYGSSRTIIQIFLGNGKETTMMAEGDVFKNQNGDWEVYFTKNSYSRAIISGSVPLIVWKPEKEEVE